VPQDGVRLTVVGRRPRLDAVDPLRHGRVQLGRHAASTTKPEDEPVAGGALAFQSRLPVIRVTDADMPQRVEHAEVESAVEWTALVLAEEPRAVDERPVIPAHQLVVTERSVRRRLQQRLLQLCLYNNM